MSRPIRSPLLRIPLLESRERWGGHAHQWTAWAVDLVATTTPDPPPKATGAATPAPA